MEKKAEDYSLYNYFNSYGLCIILWVFLLMLLGLPNYSLISLFLQSLFLLGWTYFGHIYAHMISKVYPFNIINPHVSLHHNHTLEMPRWLNLTIESFVDFFAFFILVIFQKLMNIELLSTSMIIGAGLLYVSIHIFDYSIFGSKSHAQHHVNKFCNYAPDFLDVLFHTKCNPEDPYENMNDTLPFGLIAISLAFLAKLIFKLN